jgi:integral membrane protein
MTPFLTTDLGRLRLVSLLEGISYLVLIGVGVPLKYWLGHPEVVQIAGRVHGGLFVVFLIALARVAVSAPWPPRKVLSAFIAAVIPFGAFWLEHQLRQPTLPTLNQKPH